MPGFSLLSKAPPNYAREPCYPPLQNRQQLPVVANPNLMAAHEKHSWKILNGSFGYSFPSTYGSQLETQSLWLPDITTTQNSLFSPSYHAKQNLMLGTTSEQ
jgi:hypothetical protein